MQISSLLFATEPISVKVTKNTFVSEGILWKKYFVVSEFEVKNIALHPIYIATQQNPEMRLYISSSVLHIDNSPMHCRDVTMEEPFWTLFERILPGQIKYLNFRKRLDKKSALPESLEYNLVYYDSKSIAVSECIDNKGNDKILMNCFCLEKTPKYKVFTGRVLIR